MDDIKKLTVGVAMATRNGAKYLPEMLASIKKQDRQPDLLIACDDDSSDETVQILMSFAANVNFPVRLYLNTPALGVFKNFLKAFVDCSTDIIAYADQDDYWFENKLSIIEEVFHRQASLSMVWHQSMTTDQYLNPMGLVLPGNLPAGTFHWPFIPTRVWGFGHQMAFKRSVVDVMINWSSNLPSNTAIASNLDLLIPYASCSLGSIHHIKMPLMYFRRHSASTSPAGKGGAIKSKFFFDRYREENRNAIASHLSVVSSLVSAEDHLGIIKPEFFGKLKSESLSLSRRLTILTSVNLSKRLGAFCQGILDGFYKPIGFNGWSLKMLLVDLFFSLKGLKK